MVRAFVRLREMLNAHRALARKLSELEKKVEDATCVSPWGSTRAPGQNNHTTGAFCFFELSIATQGYE